MTTEKHEPHFSCAGCADLQSLPADHLRTHGGELWCDDCWDGLDKGTETGIEYTDLQAFVPESDLKIQALTEGLQAIKQHLDSTGMVLPWQMRNTADAALNKAEAIGK